MEYSINKPIHTAILLHVLLSKLFQNSCFLIVLPVGLLFQTAWSNFRHLAGRYSQNLTSNNQALEKEYCSTFAFPNHQNSFLINQFLRQPSLQISSLVDDTWKLGYYKFYQNQMVVISLLERLLPQK